MWKPIDTHGVIDMTCVENLQVQGDKVIATYLVSDIKRKALERFDSESAAIVVLGELRAALMFGRQRDRICSISTLKNYNLENVIYLDVDPKDGTRIVMLVKEQRRKNITLGQFKNEAEANLVLEELRTRLIDDV